MEGHSGDCSQDSDKVLQLVDLAGQPSSEKVPSHTVWSIHEQVGSGKVPSPTIFILLTSAFCCGAEAAPLRGAASAVRLGAEST
eukprot:scaffold5420_cov77-Cylindrotheca_fusiformis.AAC.5